MLALNAARQEVCVYLHVSVFLDGQVKDPTRVVMETPDDIIQSQASIADGGQQQWQHRLQAGVSRRWVVAVLLLHRVGG